jgi:hypothetical protein
MKNNKFGFIETGKSVLDSQDIIELAKQQFKEQLPVLDSFVTPRNFSGIIGVTGIQGVTNFGGFEISEYPSRAEQDIERESYGHHLREDLGRAIEQRLTEELGVGRIHPISYSISEDPTEVERVQRRGADGTISYIRRQQPVHIHIEGIIER